MSRAYKEGWQRIADQVLGSRPTERRPSPPTDDVDISDDPGFHDVGTLLSREQARRAPRAPEQSATPATREANIAALRSLFQRVESAQSEIPGVEIRTGMFDHYGPDTRSLLLSHDMDGATQTVSIHNATYFGAEGIVGIVHENGPAEGAIWWDETAAIRRASEILDAKGVPPLSAQSPANEPPVN